MQEFDWAATPSDLHLGSAMQDAFMDRDWNMDTKNMLNGNISGLQEHNDLGFDVQTHVIPDPALDTTENAMKGATLQSSTVKDDAKTPLPQYERMQTRNAGRAPRRRYSPALEEEYDSTTTRASSKKKHAQEDSEDEEANGDDKEVLVKIGFIATVSDLNPSKQKHSTTGERCSQKDGAIPRRKAKAVKDEEESDDYAPEEVDARDHVIDPNADDDQSSHASVGIYRTKPSRRASEPHRKSSSSASNKKSPGVATPTDGEDPVRKNAVKTMIPLLKTTLNDLTAQDTQILIQASAGLASLQAESRNEQPQQQDTSNAKLSADEISSKLAELIENALFEHLADPDPKSVRAPPKAGERYKTKFRSLLFNFKDKANKNLRLGVVTGEITPSKLVRMNAEELANPKLKEMSEKIREQSLKEVVLKPQEQPIIIKTHKGDELLGGGVFYRDTEAEQKAKSQRSEKQQGAKPLSRNEPTRTSRKSETLDEILARMGQQRDDQKSPDLKHSDDDEDESGTASKRARFEHESIDVDPAQFDDVDDHYSPSPEPDLSPEKDYQSDVGTPPAMPDGPVWKGELRMVQVAAFKATAEQIGGRRLTEAECDQVFTESLEIEGRIPPSRVEDYLTQMQFSSSKELILLDIKASLEAEGAENAGLSAQSQFEVLFDYFHSKDRYGVIAKAGPQLKDLYVVPVKKTESLPNCLITVQNSLPEDERTADLLLGIIVLHKANDMSHRRSHSHGSRHHRSVKQNDSPILRPTDSPPLAPTTNEEEYVPFGMEEPYEPTPLPPATSVPEKLSMPNLSDSAIAQVADIVRNIDPNQQKGTPEATAANALSNDNPLLSQLLSNPDVLKLLNSLPPTIASAPPQQPQAQPFAPIRPPYPPSAAPYDPAQPTPYTAPMVPNSYRPYPNRPPRYVANPVYQGGPPPAWRPRDVNRRRRRR
ncbi:hypothetical protein BZG36_04597 [Bifiguratus adelaidae]|uniref:TFIIS central domain-containing protein n=1 Tax=Bifiguratus adelaidae TaxID=1938954 RepID=A0A261XWS9_9FUNG|nr:hypothetical protein BZG36_04597 [Bifiguratus adelaidae]